MQPCSDEFSFRQSSAKDVLPRICESKKITLHYDSDSSDYEPDLEILGNGKSPSKISSLVNSPLVFNFCEMEPDENSQITKDVPIDSVETAVMSPQCSETSSYESPDAVSLNSLDGFSSCEKTEEENDKTLDKKDSGNEEVEVEPTKNEVELKEREECDLEESNISLLNSNGRPMFESSFDYNHKSLNFDVVNEYAGYLKHYHERFPANYVTSSRVTSHSKRCKYTMKFSPGTRGHHSHSPTMSGIHSKYKTRFSPRVKVHSCSSYFKHHRTRYFNNYKHEKFPLSPFYNPTPNSLTNTKSKELEAAPISSISEPKCNKDEEPEDPIGTPHIPLTNGSTSSKMVSVSYKCPECPYTSVLNQVITHYCYRHFTILCPSCDKLVEEPFFLHHCRHCKSSKPKLDCPNCPLSCTGSSLLSLAMHVMCTHPTKKCIACEDDFIPHKFIEHAKICFFGPKHRYVCPFCECSVAATKLTEHVVSHPITECPLCFSDICYHEAEQHMESCYLEKVNDSEESFSGSVFNCPLCQHRFSFENMSHHIVLKHLVLNCVFCYAGMSHDQMKEHLLLCCQQHQRKTDDSKE